jgi:hypothetical protein
MCGNLSDAATALLWYSIYSMVFWPLGLANGAFEPGATVSQHQQHHCITWHVQSATWALEAHLVQTLNQ